MEYNYTMGFAVNGIPIPDPTAFSGKDSALDSMGNRDATGYLHRNMVATKHPLKIEYSNFGWNMIEEIMHKLTGEKLLFTYPDPRQGQITIEAYVGDREWEAIHCPGDDMFRSEWIGNLKFSVIEY